LQVSELLLRELRYVRELALVQDVSYVEFLDRVHAGELKQHPWLHLFLPRSHILKFTVGVFTVDRGPPQLQGGSCSK
jgi:cytokinin dehydrogenase